MEVDDEMKGAAPASVTVDATKVTEEKDEEEKSAWAYVEGDAPL